MKNKFYTAAIFKHEAPVIFTKNGFSTYEEAVKYMDANYNRESETVWSKLPPHSDYKSYYGLAESTTTQALVTGDKKASDIFLILGKLYLVRDKGVTVNCTCIEDCRIEKLQIATEE